MDELKPMSYVKYCELTDEERLLYLKKIQKKYHVDYEDLANMLGLSFLKASAEFSRIGFSIKQSKIAAKDEKKWKKFLVKY